MVVNFDYIRAKKLVKKQMLKMRILDQRVSTCASSKRLQQNEPNTLYIDLFNDHMSYGFLFYIYIYVLY